jgi:hypothetical protein
MKTSHGVLLAMFVLGCGPRPAHAPEPSSGGDASEACGQGAPSTPAHCECLGGYVRGDIGDGQVACPQGETELERVNQGIEGAVCCKRMVE